jgi:hypothetical protein
MNKRIIAGQTLIGIALLLLAVVAGLFPRVSGSYPYRPAEMLGFWLGFALILAGLRLTRSTLSLLYHPSPGGSTTPNAAGASLAVLVGVLVCLFSLLNFFYTTLWGLRLLPEGVFGGRQLIPSGMGVAWMALPLLITAACQLPLLLRSAKASGAAPLPMQRPGVLFWLALAASVPLFILFVLTSLASLANRHALAIVVGVTLLESLVMALVALEQFVWSLPRIASVPPPYTASQG